MKNTEHLLRDELEWEVLVQFRESNGHFWNIFTLTFRIEYYLLFCPLTYLCETVHRFSRGYNDIQSLSHLQLFLHIYFPICNLLFFPHALNCVQIFSIILRICVFYLYSSSNFSLILGILYKKFCPLYSSPDIQQYVFGVLPS